MRYSCLICRIDLKSAGCPKAPRICSECRKDPEKLKLARGYMKEHLQEHRDAGDFAGIMSPFWRDPAKQTRGLSGGTTLARGAVVI